MIEIIRGDDVELEFTFTDIDGNAVDLTESTVFFTVKKYAKDEDDDALIVKDFDFVGTGTSGILTLWLEAEETDIDVGVYSYDVQILDKEGYVFSSQAGKLKVNRDITVRTTISA